MPRIRTIKPEFWDSPDTDRASAVARLLFIAMWNWADDSGRGSANLKELEGFAFPNDDVEELSGGICRSFRHALAEVRDCYGVVFYKVAGRPYFEIPSWRRHQRNERVAKGKHPVAADGEPWDFMGPNQGRGGTSDTLRRDAAEPDRAASEAVGSSGTGTGEQGNRGTGTTSAPPPEDAPGGEAVEGEIVDEQSTSTELDTAKPVTAQTILAWLIDCCTAAEIDLPKKLIGHYSKEIKNLLDEGQPPQRITAALRLMAEDNILNRPSLLPNKVMTVQTGPEKAPRREARSTTDDRVSGWLDLDMEVAA
jgi:hypothetical protein